MYTFCKSKNLLHNRPESARRVWRWERLPVRESGGSRQSSSPCSPATASSSSARPSRGRSLPSLLSLPLSVLSPAVRRTSLTQYCWWYAARTPATSLKLVKGVFPGPGHWFLTILLAVSYPYIPPHSASRAHLVQFWFTLGCWKNQYNPRVVYTVLSLPLCGRGSASRAIHIDIILHYRWVPLADVFISQLPPLRAFS